MQWTINYYFIIVCAFEEQMQNHFKWLAVWIQFVLETDENPHKCLWHFWSHTNTESMRIILSCTQQIEFGSFYYLWSTYDTRLRSTVYLSMLRYGLRDVMSSLHMCACAFACIRNQLDLNWTLHIHMHDNHSIVLRKIWNENEKQHEKGR